MKNLIIICLVFLLLISNVIAVGVTYPVPDVLELKKGETGKFRVQIQASGSPIKCVYTAPENNVLEIKFDSDETIVDANGIENVFGNIRVLNDADNGGRYDANICVLCSGLNKVGRGSSINIEFCNLPLAVDVVDVRTRENMFKEQPVQKVNLLPIVLIIAVIVILGYLYAKQKKEKKKRR